MTPLFTRLGRWGVLFAALAVAAIASCAKSGGHADDQDGGGSGGGTTGDDGSVVLPPPGGSSSGTIVTTGDDGGSSVMPPPTVLPNLTGLTVSPASVTLTYMYGSMNGAQQQFTAKGTFSDGSTMDVTSSVGWAVSPSGAGAGAPGGGLFQAFAAGQFTITAIGDDGNGTSITATAMATVKATGSVVVSGVPMGAQTGLDSASAGSGPRIVYPLDGALFPSNFAPLDFQVVASAATQTVARLAFEGDLIDLKVYAPCTPIPSPAIANGCRLSIPSDVDSALQTSLVGASAADKLTETVRLAAQDGSGVAESSSISARWATDKLHGGLYYWASAPPGTQQTNMIKQVNLDRPGPAPVVFYTNADTQPLPGGQYYQPCFGCHAISYDGSKIALSFGGSIPSQFALLDTQSKTAFKDDAGNASVRIQDDAGNTAPPFATRTTFSPDGKLMVQLLAGKLLVRSADATLANMGTPLFTTLPGASGELVTAPYWSPKGDLLVFASWQGQASACTATSLSGSCTGDLIQNAQLWIAAVMGATGGALPTFGTPTLLVPRTTNKTEYYPAISDDSKFVIFNESSCDGPSTPGTDNWGGGACDSYDDPSATLRLVSATGGSPVYLANASNVKDPSVSSSQQTWSNSWPRFSPPDPKTMQHGTFRGKTLYWISFSSRRPYGAVVAGTNNPSMTDTTPQLWFAAVAVDPSGSLSGDPSYAPIWLPQQNDAQLPDGGTADSGGVPRGNHLPQWVTKAVSVISEIAK